MVFQKKGTIYEKIRQRRDTSGSNEIAKAREKIFEKICSHPWELFTAVDYDGTPIVVTKDEKDIENTGAHFKPYPYNDPEKQHLKPLVMELMDPDTTLLIIPKSRQIMASYTTLLVAWWKTLIFEGQNTIVSRKKQSTSIKLMKDKIRDTHLHLPQWLRDRWQLSSVPKEIITALNTGSTITAVSQEFANSETRGDSASEVIVDEAAFQDNLPKIMTAGISMARHIRLISSPTKQGPGSEVMQGYMRKIRDNAISVTNPSPGVTITTARVGETGAKMVMFEAYIKSTEQTKKSSLYLNESARKQEQEGDWNATEGRAYFPEVELYGGEATYNKPCTDLDINLPIDRGWDFGVMRPACVWSQYNPVTNRVHVVRDILGQEIDPWSFGLLVKYLSNQIPLEALANHVPAMRALSELKNRKNAPGVPWFGQGFVFRDFGGHEALREIATGAGAKLQSFAAIFRGIGIYLNPRFVPKERREYILRQCLKPREVDKIPTILFDVQGAPISFQGVLNGLVRPIKLKSDDPEEPVDDHYYKDVYDALGYTLVGTMNHVDWAQVKTTSEAVKRDSKPVEYYQSLTYKRWTPPDDSVDDRHLTVRLAERW